MPKKRVFVAGHRGMVGSAIVRKLRKDNCQEIVTAEKSDLNLTNQRAVMSFFSEQHIDEVYLAAAKVGGIQANNNYPADFIYNNLMIQSNVINAAHNFGVQKLLFLGSSCIYPKLASQPMSENSLLTGLLEPTNEAYAIAKIAGIKLCESYNRQFDRDYRSIMPSNLYGPGDNYQEGNSHVIPSLIRRFHEAKKDRLDEVVAWGSGKPRREFLHVDDMADASIYVLGIDRARYMENTEPMLSHLNIGSGVDYSIRDLTEMIARVVGYNGKIVWDQSKPDGTPKKLMNNEKVQELGWSAIIGLEAGLIETYDGYLNNLGTVRS
jgi:GDP-L-fucose synthase